MILLQYFLTMLMIGFCIQRHRYHHTTPKFRQVLLKIWKCSTTKGGIIYQKQKHHQEAKSINVRITINKSKIMQAKRVLAINTPLSSPVLSFEQANYRLAHSMSQNQCCRNEFANIPLVFQISFILSYTQLLFQSRDLQFEQKNTKSLFLKSSCIKVGFVVVLKV